MLAKMFNGDMRPGQKDEDGAYLIDRSPVYFHPILNYFRTGKVIIDPNISADGVLEEAKYFGIESLISELEKYRNATESEPHSSSSLNIMDRKLNTTNKVFPRETVICRSCPCTGQIVA